jgi:acetylornithine deacetylase/succinyl-diaminopimelate desuccinylase-like protein
MWNWLNRELLRLLSIPSPTGQETPLLLYLESKADLLGVPVSRQYIQEDRWNLILNPRSEPEWILVAHVDTVPETIQGETCPFRQEGEVIWGRGAADTKGAITALLGVMRLAREAGWDWEQIPVSIAFTVDEEQEALGSQMLAREIQAQAGLVLEPTELAVCASQAGSFQAKVDVGGQAAHGSLFEEGQNAVLRAASTIESFKRLFYLAPSQHPRLGTPGYSVHYISGGSEELVIPNLCSFLVEFRLLPGQDMNQAMDSFAAFCRQEGVSYQIMDISPPAEIPEDSWVTQKVLAAAEKALGKSELAGMLSWTDAEHLISQGIPSVVFGPGKLSLCHTAAEQVTLSQVEEASRVMQQLIQDVVGQDSICPAMDPDQVED